MTTNPQALFEATKCYACYAASPYMLDLIELGLLAQIAAGVSSGAGPNLTGTGSPEGLVTANPGTIYFDTSANAMYYKASGTGNTGWIPLIT